MTFRRSSVFLAPLALATCLAGVKNADAIPAFARQNKTECTTCHTIFPQRNEFGKAFERNGFVWPGKASTAKATNKPEEYLTLSGLPDPLPISIIGEAEAVFNDNSQDKLNFAIEEIELLAGGSTTDGKVGFYLAQILGPGDSETEDAFVVLRNLCYSSMNVRIGNIRPNLSLWQSNDRLIDRLATSTLAVHDVSVRNFAPGVEVNSIIGDRLFVAAGVLDPNYDNETERTEKSYFVHGAFKVGGADMLGKESDVNLDKSENLMDFMSVTIGAFGYRGTHGNAGSLVQDQDLGGWFRAGLEAGISYKKLDIRLSGVTGNNSSATDADDIDSNAVAAEVSYGITGKLIASVTAGHTNTKTATDVEESNTTITPGIVYAPRQNASVTAAVEYENPTGGESESSVIMGLKFAL